MNDTKREIILKHYESPRNRGLIDDKTYLTSNTSNDSCIDEINLMAKIEDDIIKDIKFDGEACVICISSTSIMIDTLLNKSLSDVIKIYDNFDKMINGEEYNKNVLDQAVVFDDIKNQVNRKKCALLPWIGIYNIINKYEKKS